jgi:hypothetical protein
LIIILNSAHDPVDFDNLNAEVFADYMMCMAEHRTAVIWTSFDGKQSALNQFYHFLSLRIFTHNRDPTATYDVWDAVTDSSLSTRAGCELCELVLKKGVTMVTSYIHTW